MHRFDLLVVMQQLCNVESADRIEELHDYSLDLYARRIAVTFLNC
jgi:hypothetical protein